MDAAGELFYRRGCTPSPPSASPTRPGLTKPTIYNLFGSKDALVLKTLQRRGEQIRRHIEQRAAAHDDPERKLARGAAGPRRDADVGRVSRLPARHRRRAGARIDGGPRARQRAQDVAARAARAVRAARRPEISRRPRLVARARFSKARPRCRPSSRRARRQTRPRGRARADRSPYAIIPACSGLRCGLSSPRRRCCSFCRSGSSFPRRTTCLYPLAVGCTGGQSGSSRSRRSACRDLRPLRAGATALPGSRSCLPRSHRCCRSCRSCSCRSRSRVSIARWRGRRREPPSACPGEVRVTRGVPFSKADGVPLSLDVYQPPARDHLRHHADLRRLMADGSADESGMVLALLRRARISWSWPSTIATRRNG